MTSAIDKNQTFERDMRALHHASLAQLSPQTLTRLRAARHDATQAAPQRAHGWRWMLASAFSAVLAVAIGVQFLPGPATDTHPLPAPAIASAGNDGDYTDTVAAFDESPDLYLWLASQDAATLAME